MNPHMMIAEGMIVPTMEAVRAHNNVEQPVPAASDIAAYLQNGGVCPVCAFLAQLEGIVDCPACMMRESGL